MPARARASASRPRRGKQTVRGITVFVRRCQIRLEESRVHATRGTRTRMRFESHDIMARDVMNQTNTVTYTHTHNQRYFIRKRIFYKFILNLE